MIKELLEQFLGRVRTYDPADITSSEIKLVSDLEDSESEYTRKGFNQALDTIIHKLQEEIKELDK